MIVKTSLKVGNKSKPGVLLFKDNRIFINYGYWPNLNGEIKKMDGYKWHGYDKVPLKMWSVKDNPRNNFQLDYMRADKPNPYEHFDKAYLEVQSRRPLYDHQLDLFRHAVTVHYCIWAAEMGTGKTLSVIEVAEHAFASEIKPGTLLDCEQDFWYVAPKAALAAVEREFKKWNAQLRPKFLTYERNCKEIEQWESGKKAPRFVVFDESSRLKTPSAKRSQAALHLADNVRAEWGMDGYVIEMSGSPAPKSPADWWHQCEVAWPGFLVEGNIHIFQRRVGVLTERENTITGGKYAQLVTWKDDETKCSVCGQLDSSPNHDAVEMAMKARTDEYHKFEACQNEVSKLYRRMKGLVNVKFKKDCLDLPDKRYECIRLAPTPSVLRAAKLITTTSPTAIRALTLLRELSDGFQYQDITTGEQVACPVCHGLCTETAFFTPEGNRVTGEDVNSEIIRETVPCTRCDATGEVDKVTRITKLVECPKDEAYKDLLSQHEETGRIVTYAGFTGSIDRVVSLCKAKKWSVIRVDGRGWVYIDAVTEAVSNIKPVDLLDIFQDKLEQYPLVAFVGHPGSAGMGLTLTASPSVVYFSNDFNAESRIQSEDRIHRPGMDVNKGATIYDLLHLPTDYQVLDNLKAKRKLQSVSLGELDSALKLELTNADRSG